MKRGLLLTLTEPPPAMEEEFNAWYDEERLPERLAIPGFRSARRWVSGRTYLARYQNQTPWSRRCLSKCLVFKRRACEQIEPEKPSRTWRAAQGVLQARKFAATSGERITLHELGTFDHHTADAYRLYQP